jgi:hypothetical protein
MSTPYYDPAAFGLELLDTLDEPGMGYSFHMLCAWRETATGDLLWAEDSGCSCPAPFESFTKAGDFSHSREDLRVAVEAFNCDPLDKRRFREKAGL